MQPTMEQTAGPSLVRLSRADDLEPLFAAMDTAEVRAAFHLPAGFSRSDAWASLCSLAGLWELRGLGQWALEEQATGRFVGRAGLYWRFEDDWPGVEVGWMLDPAAWGSGYATEAGARAAQHGFEMLGEQTLYSVILPGNARSQAVARRLGFEPGIERTMSFFPARPHVVWELPRARWQAAISAS